MRGMGMVVLPLLAGCDAVTDALGVKAPTAELARVDAVRQPTVDELVGYGCSELFGKSFCEGTGIDVPPKSDLLFSFDLVFDLTNNNRDLPIPLVETLLGFTAFEDANLGAVCISFCDPDEEDCVPGVNEVGACDTEGATDVQGPEDLVPTVEELVGLAEDAAEGDLDNGDWRTIGPDETIEAHIRFDLGIDPMLQIADELLVDAADDALSGRNVKVDVPYIVEGTLFFDVPELGTHLVGFGPFDDTWVIQ